MDVDYIKNLRNHIDNNLIVGGIVPHILSTIRYKLPYKVADYPAIGWNSEIRKLAQDAIDDSIMRLPSAVPDKAIYLLRQMLIAEIKQLMIGDNNESK